MDKMTVKIGNYELDVNEEFIKSFCELKEYMSCWRSTLDDLSALVTIVGSQDGEDVDYRKLFTLLRNIGDIRRQMDSLVLARVVSHGKEIKDID